MNGHTPELILERLMDKCTEMTAIRLDLEIEGEIESCLPHFQYEVKTFELFEDLVKAAPLESIENVRILDTSLYLNLIMFEEHMIKHGLDEKTRFGAFFYSRILTLYFRMEDHKYAFEHLLQSKKVNNHV